MDVKYPNRNTMQVPKWILLAMLVFATGACAQEQFPNTLFLDAGAESPQADLSAIPWLAGHWRGEAFGGIAEEIWSPALGGSMMGAFKLVVDGAVVFYELETVSEVDGTLILRLKHFNPDVTGWEEKEETVDFRLVKVTENKVYFEGFTLERISDTEINMYVVIEDGGKQTETKFNYHLVE